MKLELEIVLNQVSSKQPSGRGVTNHQGGAGGGRRTGRETIELERRAWRGRNGRREHGPRGQRMEFR